MEIINLESSDGPTSELRLFDAADSRQLLLMVPAMGVPAKKYDAFAQALVKHGIGVAVTEIRGLDSSSVRAGRHVDFGYHEIVTIDLPLALTTVRKRFPEHDVSVVGHSLGGQLATLFMAQQFDLKTAPQRLILTASCSIYYRGWSFPTNIGFLFFTQFGNWLAKLIGHFPGRQIGFAGREARSVISDWAATARHGRYELCNSDFDYEAAMGRLAKPVLAINYAEDTFAPIKATQNLLDKLSAAPISKVSLNARDISSKRADHFSWMKQPDRVAQEIRNWLIG